MADSIAAGRVRTAPPRRPTFSATAALAVLEYCARVYRRTWRGTMFMTFFSPILFLGAMGFGLGSFVDQAGTAASQAGVLGAVSYAAFLAPGLLAVTCMQTGTFEASYPVMGRLTWDKVYHAMMSTPVSVADIVAGQIGWFAVRLTLVAGAYYVVMLGFGLVPGGPASILVVPVGVLTGLCFASLIAAFSATQSNDDGFSLIFRFVVMPLFLFSGTFFPVDQLPLPLQVVAWLTPTYHGVALARDLSLGIGDPLTAVVHLGVLLAYVVAGVAASVFTFRRALVK
jgi:lipooligosaccharide transport system permease protein